MNKKTMTCPEDLFTHRYNELTEFAGSTDHYLNLKGSSILRQFLLDQTPLIHIVNKSIRFKIEFKVDNTFHHKLPLSSAILYTSTEIGNLFLKFSVNLKVLKLDQFLELPILEIDNTTFSVREIIKFASNKSGGIHYDTKVNEDEKILESSLSKLENINVPALAIAINSITNIVLIALNPLKNKLAQLPADLPFLAHYYLDKGSFFFEGKKWIHTENMNDYIDNGFGWFAEVKITHQKYNGIRFLYNIGSPKKDAFNFSVYFSQKTGLGCKVYITNALNICIDIPDFTNGILFNSFSSIACIYKAESNIASLEIYLNGILLTSKKLPYSKLFTHIDRHVIGADLKGKRSATFNIKELMLLKAYTSVDKVSEINKYFERKYRK